MATKAKSTFKPKPVSDTVDIVCPKCGCDWMVPIMKLRYTRSFAGNRMQVEWPSREGNDDYAVISCASCGEVLKVQQNGTLSLGKKLATKPD